MTEIEQALQDILLIHCPSGPAGSEICPRCYTAYPCATAKIVIGVQYG